MLRPVINGTNLPGDGIAQVVEAAGRTPKKWTRLYPRFTFDQGSIASQATLLRLLLDSLVSDERGDVLYIESLTYALAARFPLRRQLLR